AAGIAQISLEQLHEADIDGIIVDLDNTLVAYRGASIAPEVVAWVTAALERGFKVALVSNNFAERVAAIGTQLGVPTVPSAMKPLPFGFLRAVRVLHTQRSRTVVVGDQLLTDVVGAKLAGLRSILTEPISERGFVTTRVMRVIERALLRWAGVRRSQ
ncbi:MAG: YqeG family HAD IIIA-type phosphatase, partial [Candidatus Eremiobacteraeota bacterium]|nr:YqeG family HAD IIIA-type phosphatase [Candidatus Eremiobacteraeota bacterium]